MVSYRGALYLLADNCRFYKSKGPRVLVDFIPGYNILDYWRIICSELKLEYNILVASGYKQIFSYINNKNDFSVRVIKRDDNIDSNLGYSFYLSIINCNKDIDALFISDNSLLSISVVRDMFDGEASCVPYVSMYNKKFKDVGVVHDNDYVLSCMFKVKDNIWPNAVYFSSNDLNKMKSYVLSTSISFKNKLMYEIVNYAITPVGIKFKSLNVTDRCKFLFKHRSL